MSSCIIGVAFGLQRDALTVFVKSARRYWNCDIIIVGDNLSDDALSFLKENNVVWDGEHEKPSRFFMGRWQFYPPHLEQYDMALISDLIDVVFQGNPQLADGLHVTEEEVPIWREGYNTEWVKWHGEDVYERIKDYPILCAGTVWGDTDSLIQLCELMGKHDMDQGTLNVAVREKWMPATVHINGERTWTLGLYGYDWDNQVMPPVDFSIDGDKVSMPNGYIPSVIHQYNRHTNLVERFGRIYR